MSPSPNPPDAPAPAPTLPTAVLPAALVLCLLVSLAAIAAPPLLYYEDAVQYLSLGQNLAAGNGYRSDTLRFPDLMQPPLYPALIAALIRLGASAVSAAIAVCAASQVLTVLSLGLLHRLYFGRGGWQATVLIAAVYPNLAFGGALVLEPLFLLWLALAAALFAGSLRAGGRQGGGLAAAAGAGLALGLALLTRPEAVITTAVLVLLGLLWPAPLRRRLATLGVTLALLAVVIAPYGLWLRGRVGVFELIPKVRYNSALADITQRLRWEPDEASLSGREQRVFFTLMPDHATFVMNHAFDHPGVDPAAHFPLHPAPLAGEGGRARALLGGARTVLLDGVLTTMAFHPLALALLGVAALAALRRRPARDGDDDDPDGALAWPRWRSPRPLLTGALVALCGLHLAPAVLSGVDFTSRYLAASLLFSAPLVGRGVAVAGGWLRGRGLRHGPPLLLALVLLGYGVGSLRFVRDSAGGPARWARLRAIEAAAAQAIPRGARVLAEHGRVAFLRGGVAIQLPYLRDPRELDAFVAHHRITHAVLDSRTLRRNPSRVVRALASPSAWPPAFRLLKTVSLDRDPVWLVAVGPSLAATPY